MVNTILFYGARWCHECRMSKKIFDENNIMYTYIDLETSLEAADKVTKINNGLQSIPTIIFPDGNILVEPSNEELKAQLRNLSLLK